MNSSPRETEYKNSVQNKFNIYNSLFLSLPFQKITNIGILIRENKIDEIDLTLQQLGLTSLMNASKPTPLEEAKNIIYFLRSVYYDAVGDLYAHIKENFPADDFDNPEIIQLGFWPGGDRDGNPFVTSKITAQVADELRMNLMKCYYQEVKRLEQKLTFREVEDHIATLKARLYVSMFDPMKTLSVGEILSLLNQIKKLLREKFNGLYMKDLDICITNQGDIPDTLLPRMSCS